ncbi:hypothetical protein IE53DRAFT_369816 [Violaceomyces palustris]|uniref:Uncharacterized protein n=1 Tax=Violaceomyces palustris TaxID=1673888 RepID=A0ACD0NU62_9BASI|nr:hypothetical protein IE53DRAFT_369816 [Violaceomyces palustris]
MTGFANSWRGNFWGGQSSRLMGRVPPSALERLRAFRKRPQLERLEAFRARPETRLERLKAFKDPSSAQRFGTTTNAGQGARAELSQLERERQSFLERLKGWDLTELQHQQAIAESRLAAWSKSSSSNYEKLKRD